MVKKMKPLKFVTEQNIALKLLKYFRNEANRGYLYHSIGNPKARVSHALGINKRTLNRWIAGNETPTPDLNVVKTRRPKLDSFDKDVIRRVLHTMFNNQELVTLKKMKHRLTEENSIHISKQTLWKTVRELGFTFRKTKGGKNMLCERAHLVAARSKYLREIRKMRQDGFDPVFIDETWINSHHTNEKEWMSMDGTQRRNVPSSKGERIIITHAGSSEVGFIPNADLIFRSKSNDNRDYHSEMNGPMFKKWLCEKLLPNLDRPSVLVMDNASYHNVVDPEDKIPTTATRKADIQEWLRKEGVDYPLNSLKPELLSIVKGLNKSKTFSVDKLITEQGHKVLRLPPYHSHLNPIELVWGKVKGQVASENCTFKIQDVTNLAETAIGEINQEYWQKCTEHVLKEEEAYWQNDGLRFTQQPMLITLDSSESEAEHD